MRAEKAVFFIVVGWDLSPLSTAANTGQLYHPGWWMMMSGSSRCSENLQGNLSTRRKAAPVPLCPQMPHDLTWGRTPAAAVGSRRLTIRAMARPKNWLLVWTFPTLDVFPSSGMKHERILHSCAHAWRDCVWTFPSLHLIIEIDTATETLCLKKFDTVDSVQSIRLFKVVVEWSFLWLLYLVIWLTFQVGESRRGYIS
jgi:hypothetical protein